jgi:HEAT repeat protein
MAELQNGNAETRSQAVVALAMSGSLAAVEPLIATLKNHSNPQVRLGAIQALWRLGDMRALEPLQATLTSKVMRIAIFVVWRLMLLASWEIRGLLSP